jgi:hypothetical protein
MLGKRLTRAKIETGEATLDPDETRVALTSLLLGKWLTFPNSTEKTLA